MKITIVDNVNDLRKLSEGNWNEINVALITDIMVENAFTKLEQSLKMVKIGIKASDFMLMQIFRDRFDIFHKWYAFKNCDTRDYLYMKTNDERVVNIIIPVIKGTPFKQGGYMETE